MAGQVWIIGAGPGDPGLLTLKAAERIRAAEVIVYDRLLGAGILELAAPDAELIYVGKAADCHTASQAAINQILVEQAQQGKKVARIKGGDPFLFGRGGEEAETLAALGISFEIVPGVTSAIAVPAYAGIPVTHRDFASSLHIITGHERVDRADASVDLQKLSGLAGTLVFLMGLRSLSRIAADLIGYGKDPETPAAVIEKGTTAEQRVITGKLGEIALRAEAARLQSPAVLVIGAVASLREKLTWFPRQGPLSGKKILLTRPREQSSALGRRIAELGGEVIQLPVIQIIPPTKADLEKLDQALEQIEQYSWLVFTSVNGVKAFWKRWQFKRLDIRRLAALKFAVVGPATGDALMGLGIHSDLIPTKFTTAWLTDALLKNVRSRERVLLCRSELASAEMPSRLTAAGITCDALVAYRVAESRIETRVWEDLQQGRFDYLTFTSSSTVQNFMGLLPAKLRPNLLKTKAVCIGPVTAAAALEAGLKVAGTADVCTIEGLVAKIEALEGGNANVTTAATLTDQ